MFREWLVEVVLRVKDYERRLGAGDIAQAEAVTDGKPYYVGEDGVVYAGRMHAGGEAIGLFTVETVDGRETAVARQPPPQRHYERSLERDATLHLRERGLRYSLRTLREAVGKTHVDVAHAADMTQGEISRLESRDDSRRSTLERYAHAVGGKLRISIEIEGRSYEIA